MLRRKFRLPAQDDRPPGQAAANRLGHDNVAGLDLPRQQADESREHCDSCVQRTWSSLIEGEGVEAHANARSDLDDIAAEFKTIIDDYVARRYPARTSAT